MGVFFHINAVALLEDIPVFTGGDAEKKGYSAAATYVFYWKFI